MRTVTIPEALAYTHGETIPAIEGAIVWVGDIKERDDRYAETGKSTWQSALLTIPNSEKDEPNSSIYINVKNQDIAGLRGNEVRIECKDGTRGLYGITKSVREGTGNNAGKVYHNLNVTVAPKVKGNGPAEQPSAPAQQPPAQNPTPSASQPAPVAQPPAQPAPAPTPAPVTQADAPSVQHNPQFVNACMKMAVEIVIADPNFTDINPGGIKDWAKELMRIQIELERTPV